MAQSSKSRLSFPTATGLPLDAAFDAGRLTSDGGLPWLSEADHALALCETLAACIPDWRQRRGQHDLVTLVRQRVYQIACGYADQDDATTLRHDPLFKLACGRLPASGAPLASQPTLSRLENAIDRHTNERLAGALVARHLQRRGQDGVPTQILLDLDGTDAPVHGQQEGGAYHGYDRQPLRRAGAASVAAGAAGGLALSGFWQMPIIFLSRSLAFFRAPLLRSGTDGTAAKVIAIPDHPLRWPCACALTAALPRRASIAGAEQAGVGYTIGLIPNPTLERAAADLLAAAQAQSAEQGGAKVRLAGETVYQAGSWECARRVVYKAEVLPAGPNTRFVVTTDAASVPLEVYDTYVDRGQAETFSKDFKRALLADRLSDHRFWANQFRLLLHAAAYALLHTVRDWLAGAEAARYQFDTLRLRLLKGAGRVRELPQRIALQLASSHPGEPLWRALAARHHRS
jgi:hypothetical protein